MDARLRLVEQQLGDARVAVAKAELVAAQVHEEVVLLRKVVCDLRDIVQDLRDDVNKGRGVIWAVGGTSGGIIGAFLLWLAGKFLSH